MNKIEETILRNQLDILVALRKLSDDPNIRLILGDRAIKTEDLIKSESC